MRSRRGFYGAIALLLLLPVAIVSSVAFGDEETGLHLALAAGAWLFAAAVFDFRVVGWLNRATSVALAVVGDVFFLQAVSPLTGSDAFYEFSYDTLGQALEGSLTLWFVTWCVAMLLSDTRGKTRLFGLVTVLPLFAYVAATFVLKQTGDGGLPEALKLLFLPVMVWLLMESKKPAEASGVYFTLGLSEVAKARQGSSQDASVSFEATSSEFTKTMPAIGRPVNSIS
jgi:hypothetical protein